MPFFLKCGQIKVIVGQRIFHGQSYAIFKDGGTIFTELRFINYPAKIKIFLIPKYLFSYFKNIYPHFRIILFLTLFLKCKFRYNFLCTARQMQIYFSKRNCLSYAYVFVILCGCPVKYIPNDE